MIKPGRAYWKGHLRLSLVSIPVEIFNAVETAESISFNQIHKPNGKRLKYTKTVPGVGVVPADEIVNPAAKGSAEPLPAKARRKAG